MDVWFRKKRLKLVLTDHAQLRLKSREVTIEMVIDVIQTGKVKPKGDEDRFWIYKDFSGRDDNSICLSVVVETPYLIVVTALVNWRPEL
jgi:hypothetical protein